VTLRVSLFSATRSMEHLSKATMVRFKRIARPVTRSVMASFQSDWRICRMLVLILLKRLFISALLWDRDRLGVGAWRLVWEDSSGRRAERSGYVCSRNINILLVKLYERYSFNFSDHLSNTIWIP